MTPSVQREKERMQEKLLYIARRRQGAKAEDLMSANFDQVYQKLSDRTTAAANRSLAEVQDAFKTLEKLSKEVYDVKQKGAVKEQMDQLSKAVGELNGVSAALQKVLKAGR